MDAFLKVSVDFRDFGKRFRGQANRPGFELAELVQACTDRRDEIGRTNGCIEGQPHKRAGTYRTALDLNDTCHLDATVYGFSVWRSAAQALRIGDRRRHFLEMRLLRNCKR